MNIKACDLCGEDVKPFSNDVEMPVGAAAASKRGYRLTHPYVGFKQYVWINVVDGKRDGFDICQSCHRKAIQKYLEKLS